MLPRPPAAAAAPLEAALDPPCQIPRRREPQPPQQQPLPVGKAPWPYYKHGMPPAAEAKAAAGVPFAPTGAWASPVFSDCSDTSCCSPAPQPKARSPPNFFSKMKKMQQQSKDQTRGEKHEAMDRLRTEQGTRLEEQEGPFVHPSMCFT